MPALQSRCTRFRFAPLRADQIVGRLTEVIVAEGVNVPESGRDAILQLAGGDLRRVLNLLQSADMAYDCVNEEAVYLTAGAAIPAVIEGMFYSLLNDNFETAYSGMLKVINLCCTYEYLSCPRDNLCVRQGYCGLWLRLVGHYERA